MSRYQLSLIVASAMLSLAFAAGCAEKPSPPPEHEPHTEHSHPSHGPHGGELIELGAEEYHAEFLHDLTTGEMTIHILDSSAKDQVAVNENDVTLNIVLGGGPQQFEMDAVNAADGEASEFRLVNAEVLDAIETSEQPRARLTVTIEGKPFVGKIDHHEHEGHAH